MRFYEITQPTEPNIADHAFVEPFMAFAAEQLGLTNLPTVDIVSDGSLGPSFGSYQPGEGKIQIALGNRHPVDVMRTLAHEMIHYSQDLKGELQSDSGRDGSPQENEANSRAGVIMRRYGKANPDIFGMDGLQD
jgi:hypothetical protein